MRFRCNCGETIRDQTDHLPYKAHFVKDIVSFELFDWFSSEMQSYVEAVESNSTVQWLKDHGYNQRYIDLKLSHGAVLHDHLLRKFVDTSGLIFECESCGRICVEVTDTRFAFYAPDSGIVHKPFSASPIVQNALEADSKEGSSQ